MKPSTSDVQLIGTRDTPAGTELLLPLNAPPRTRTRPRRGRRLVDLGTRRPSEVERYSEVLVVVFDRLDRYALRQVWVPEEEVLWGLAADFLEAGFLPSRDERATQQR
jgi:hypothetical protein